MKKIGLFIVPLISLSFAISCDKKPEPGPEPTPEKIYHTVIFDTNGGSTIESKQVEDGTTLEEPIPVKEKTDIFTYNFVCWHKVMGTKIDQAAFNFSTPITSDLTLQAEWKNINREYVANAKKSDVIIYQDKDGNSLTNVKVVAGKQFEFQMKIADGQQDYILPTNLTITSGGTVPIGPTYYKIEREGTDFKTAKVTIEPKAVKGDIVISGTPLKFGNYVLNVDNYGVKVDGVEDGELYPCNTNKEITFKQIKDYALPNDENIILSIDGGDWVNPITSGGKCTYDSTAHKLTINANQVNSSIVIKVRSPGYEILENLSWNQISEYSTYGYAPYLFYVGEEKNVKVNNLDHKVRIIGFNHDDLASGTAKAGITFEFANVITSSDHNAYQCYWNNKEGKNSTNMDFVNHSTLNDLLQPGEAGVVYNMLPTELTNNAKQVVKDYEYYDQDKNEWTTKNYQTKLFPLSYSELNERNLVKAYEFYIGKSEETAAKLRIKKPISGSGGEWFEKNYYTRTANHSAGTSGQFTYAYGINEYGFFDTDKLVNMTKNSIAPGFCI